MMMNAVSLLLLAAPEPSAVFDYEVELDVRSRVADVELTVRQADAVISEITFLGERFFEIVGEDIEEVEDGHRWTLPDGGGKVSWKVRLEHERSERAYDARATPSWAIFRGSDIVPLMRLQRAPDTELADMGGTVKFSLPGSWSIWGPWGKQADKKRKILPSGGFPAPRGWFLAGKVSQASVERAGTKVTLVAPETSDGRLYERAAFLSMTLPAFKEITKASIDHILVVSADDPMWRGGLSGPSSFFLHVARPLVSPDRTSPVLHELFHVASRARSRRDADWIVEGLAEWVGLRVLLAAGAITEEEFPKIIANHEKRGRKAKNLLRGPSTGAKTHRAVHILDELSTWIRSETGEEKSLEDVAAKVCIEQEPFDTTRFIEMVTEVAGTAPNGFFAKHKVLPKSAMKVETDTETSTGGETQQQQEASPDWSHDDG